MAIGVALIQLPAAAGGQGARDPLDRRFDSVRALLVADPARGLREGMALEHDAALRKGRTSRLVAASKWLQAEAYVRLDDTANAQRKVAEALAILQKVRPRTSIEGDVLRTRGDMAADRADVSRALSDYQGAYRVYRATGNPRGQAMALLSIGSLYREGADFDAALRYYGQAIDTYDADPLLLVSLLNNRGNVLTDMGEYRRAIVDFERALDGVRKLDNPAFETQILRNLARAQRGTGATDLAWQTVGRGMRLARTLNSKATLDQFRTLAARLAIDRGDKALAHELVDTAFAGVDLETTPLASRDNHGNAYAVYLATGDTAKALAHLAALDRLNERATQVAISAKTALMAARFDFQNQELRIARLQQEELRRKVELERAGARFQRILFGAIAAAVAVLVALLSFGVVTLRRSRNAVRSANVELGATNAALGKALKAKGDFLATTSHEIRTPLNGILGMTQVMLADPALTPSLRDRLDIVHGAGRTMVSLVNDILDVAKMEAGNLSVERLPTDLVETITDVARLWRQQARDRGIAFVLDIGDVPRWIEGDPARLRQIVFNLLSNALKFTQAGEVAVRVTDADGRLRIAVSDSGIGIPADKIDDVFESFHQADTSTTRNFGGTGLGLTICRNLARAMGGDILLASVPGVGSTFTVDLPLVEVAQPGDATVPCVDDACRSLIVLERNPIARGMLRGLFEGKASTVEFVDDADALIARAEQGGVAAILVDAAGLRTASADPDADIARITETVRATAATGVLLLPRGEDPSIDAPGMRVFAKPVSGAKLIESLIIPPATEDSPSAALVSDAA
ncbi:ATP-binding protein [Sphingomonas sp. CFBP 13720]|uniref:ATP-binding protein n=1 Tax=Sphingomonas sp. CFBP 13720 TaxID=2775302 RepID=UPI00177BC38D|nr:ATP-binding protein [Sphingomonas sp. CFBP 13720]MBD8679098.1 tetratricopeptide repeat protein [Sphingomonas sp. CFBP 13720]